MLYKCNYCDPTITKEMRKQGIKPVKSIDTDNDEFVKDEKNKYYHINCYREHLKQRKKMNETEIEINLQERLVITQQEVQENIEKDNFLQWIMKFYDSSLPPYFLTKLHTVRTGKYEGLSEPIDYITLLDIYQHMQKYLEKVAAKKQIDNPSQQMNYDLAVVVGNYGDYKRFKERQSKHQVDKEDVERHTTVTEKVQKVNHEQPKNEEFDITDVIDELML